MSSSYFGNFPQTLFFNNMAVNITLRAAFIESLKTQSVAFYPFVIRQDERPDSLAYDYYDSPEYDWLIFLANDIIDPYTQWPKGLQDLEDFIIKKYGSIEEAQSTILFYRKNADVFYISNDGTQFTTTQPSVGGYTISIENTDIQITNDSYSFIDNQIDYYPVYAYDYEVELNENKRNIVLIDNDMKDSVAQQLEALLNG